MCVKHCVLVSLANRAARHATCRRFLASCLLFARRAAASMPEAALTPPAVSEWPRKDVKTRAAPPSSINNPLGSAPQQSEGEAGGKVAAFGPRASLDMSNISLWP